MKNFTRVEGLLLMSELVFLLSLNFIARIVAFRWNQGILTYCARDLGSPCAQAGLGAAIGKREAPI